MASKIRKGDKVMVIAGAQKGSVGTVTRVFPEFSKVIVEGVNRVKRHMKPTPRQPEGGIIEKDRPIHVSNVALVDPSTDKPTRVKSGEQDGKKVRIAVKSGTVIPTAQYNKSPASGESSAG
jgi:large subunit ribosomal protein L24